MLGPIYMCPDRLRQETKMNHAELRRRRRRQRVHHQLLGYVRHRQQRRELHHLLGPRRHRQQPRDLLHLHLSLHLPLPLGHSASARVMRSVKTCDFQKDAKRDPEKCLPRVREEGDVEVEELSPQKKQRTEGGRARRPQDLTMRRFPCRQRARKLQRRWTTSRPCPSQRRSGRDSATSRSSRTSSHRRPRAILWKAKLEWLHWWTRRPLVRYTEQAATTFARRFPHQG